MTTPQRKPHTMTDMARLQHLARSGDTAAAAEYLRLLDRRGERWCCALAAAPPRDLHSAFEEILADHADNWNIEEEDSRGLFAWRIVRGHTSNTGQTALAWVDPDGAQCWRVGDDDSLDSPSNACLPPPLPPLPTPPTHPPRPMNERLTSNRGSPMSKSRDMIDACHLVEQANLALTTGNPARAARLAIEAAMKFRDLAEQQAASPTATSPSGLRSHLPTAGVPTT